MGIRSVFGPLASPGLGASFRTRIPTASERGHKIAWVVFSSGFGAVVGLVEFGVTSGVGTSDSPVVTSEPRRVIHFADSPLLSLAASCNSGEHINLMTRLRAWDVECTHGRGDFRGWLGSIIGTIE